MLAKAEDLREVADYDVITKIGAEEAKSVVGDAEKFLEMVRKFIKSR